jgi:hypothetical protein
VVDELLISPLSLFPPFFLASAIEREQAERGNLSNDAVKVNGEAAKKPEVAST